MKKKFLRSNYVNDLTTFEKEFAVARNMDQRNEKEKKKAGRTSIINQMIFVTLFPFFSVEGISSEIFYMITKNLSSVCDSQYNFLEQ